MPAVWGGPGVGGQGFGDLARTVPERVISYYRDGPCSFQIWLLQFVNGLHRHDFNYSGSNMPNLFLMKLEDGCGRHHQAMYSPIHTTRRALPIQLHFQTNASQSNLAATPHQTELKDKWKGITGREHPPSIVSFIPPVIV
ncbi:hypothetical protein Tco_1233519 [Tanacetum coccineum]